MLEIGRRKCLFYASVALGTSLFLKACSNPTSTQTGSNSSTPAAGSSKAFKVAIALPGVISDKAWNQAGYEGVNIAKQKLEAETAYVEQVAQPDRAEALSDFARRGFNVVFAHGGQFDAAVEQVATQFPKTFFVAVNGSVNAENVAALRIDHLQAS